MHGWVPRIILVLGVAAPLGAQQKTTFSLGTYSLSTELPSDYSLFSENNHQLLVRALFYSPLRPDDSRGRIEIVFAAYPSTPARMIAISSLPALRHSILAGEWQQTDSTIQINGITATRVAWSSSKPAEPASQVAATMIHRGILIVGTQDSVAFALHVYDKEPHAALTLSQLEHALKTLAIVRIPDR